MLRISPDVETYIGAAQADRMRTEPHLAAGRCSLCNSPVDAMTDDVSVVIRTAYNDVVQVAILTHTTCQPSQVHRLTDTEAETYGLATLRTPPAKPDPADTIEEVEGTTVHGLTGVWPTANGGYPVLLLTLGEAIVLTDSGERTDAITTYLLGQGWELVTRTGTPPQATPPGWKLTYTGPAAEGVGRLVVYDAGGYHAADLILVPGTGWTESVQAAGGCVVYVASWPINTWTSGPDYPAIRTAVRQGTVAGATIPAVLDGAADVS